MKDILIRNATPEDAENILKIYSYYVKNTAISFEYETPTLCEFKGRIVNTLKNYPYIVIEQNGIIKGYAYAGPFKQRKAYDHSCEMTIYIDKNERGKGLGKLLYKVLETKLKDIGKINLYACIAYPSINDKYLTKDSADFHEHMGYIKVGEFHKCGYKFNNWYDMIWMEKIIGEYNH